MPEISELRPSLPIKTSTEEAAPARPLAPQNVVKNAATGDQFDFRKAPDLDSVGLKPLTGDPGQVSPSSLLFNATASSELSDHAISVAMNEINALLSGNAKLGPKVRHFGRASRLIEPSPSTDRTLGLKSYDSGRPSAIIKDIRNPDAYFVLSASSGLEWYDGKQFHKLLDNAPTQVMGAGAQDPNHPNILHIGFGDPTGTPMRGVLRFDQETKSFSLAKMNGQYPGDAHPARQVYSTDFKVSPDDSNLVFWCTNAGLFKSTDGGYNYDLVLLDSIPEGTNVPPVPPGQPNPLHKVMWSIQRTAPHSWVAAGQDVGNLTQDRYPIGGVWHSEDDGKTWTKSQLPPDLIGAPGRIELQAVDCTVGTDQPVVHALMASPDWGKTIGFMTSSDGGKTFTQPSMVNPQGVPENVLGNQTDLDVGHGQSGYDLLIVADPRNPDNIVLQGNLTTFSSNDRGKTWRESGYWDTPYANLPERLYNHADGSKGIIYYDSKNRMRVLLGNDGGLGETDHKIFDAAPGEATWRHDINLKRKTGTLIQSMTRSDSWTGPVGGGRQDNGCALTDVRTGQTRETSGGDGFCVAIGFDPNNIINTFNGYLKRSLDGGKTFEYAMNGLPTIDYNGQTYPLNQPFDRRVRALPGDKTGKTFVTIAQTVYKDATGNYQWGPGGVFKSTDVGTNWVDTQGVTTRRDGTKFNGIPGTVIDIDVSRTHPDIWGVVTDEGLVYTTTDAGKTWLEGAQVTGAGTALPTEKLNALEFDPTDPTGQHLYATSGAGWGQYNDMPGLRPAYVLESKDRGLTWTPVIPNGANPLPNVQTNLLRINPANPLDMTAGTEVGAYRTTDGGQNWLRFEDQPWVNTTGVIYNLEGTELILGTYGMDYYEAKLGKPPKQAAPFQAPAAAMLDESLPA